MGLLSIAAKAGKMLSPVIEGASDATKIAGGISGIGAAIGLGEMVGAPLAAGLDDAINGPEKMDQDMRHIVAAQTLMRARMDREQRIQRKMADNEAALAASDPTLYNNVLAGRKLPRGAVRIGGQPRRDLMERLTRLMAEGQFGGAQQEIPYGG